MHRRFVAALVTALALAGCSSDDPVEHLLTEDDVDERFSAEAVVPDAPFILRGCGIEDLGDEIDGAATASVTFNDETTGDGFTHTVSTTGDRAPADVLGEVEELVASCEPQQFIGGSGVTTAFVREPADGPELAEGAVWMATSLQVADGDEADSDDGVVSEVTPSVVFTDGEVVHFLSGPVELPWEESVAFVEDLATSL